MFAGPGERNTDRRPEVGSAFERGLKSRLLRILLDRIPTGQTGPSEPSSPLVVSPQLPVQRAPRLSNRSVTIHSSKIRSEHTTEGAEDGNRSGRRRMDDSRAIMPIPSHMIAYASRPATMILTLVRSPSICSTASPSGMRYALEAWTARARRRKA